MRPQARELKYLGIFMSDRKMKHRWFGGASVVIQVLWRADVVKRKLRQKAKFSIYQSIYVPMLTCGHQLWRSD